jgi:tetratricopeptide (TPR) repeat protein
MDPEQIAAAFVREADALAAAGRLVEAVGVYEVALGADPECGEAWVGKAGALRTLGRLQEAFEAAETALEVWPSSLAEILRNGIVEEMRRKGLVP